MRFKTENSEYEIDYIRYRVRRISGTNPPTGRFSPDGDWKQYQEVRPAVGGLLYFVWPDGKGTLTSRVIDYEYR